MTIPADKEITGLVREILTEAGKGYTPEQLAEIPNILATKYKYWWCIDMQMWDLLPDVYTEPFEAYSNGRLVPNKCIQVSGRPRRGSLRTTPWCRPTWATTP